MKIVETYGYNHLKQPPDNIILFDSLYFLPELSGEVREALIKIAMDIHRGNAKQYSKSILILVYHTYKRVS